MSDNSVLSLRPLSDIDEECSSIWNDWYDNIVIKQKPKIAKPKKTVSNFSENSQSNSKHNRNVQIIADSIYNFDEKTVREAQKQAAKLKQEKVNNIISLSKQIREIQQENNELEQQLAQLKEKYNKSKENIPNLRQEIKKSYITYELIREKREIERKKQVFKALNKK